jgi:mannose-6-phosphate isomerase-like protein (cupin superfamily)
MLENLARKELEMAWERIDLFAPSGLRLQDGGTVEVENPPRMTGEQDGWMVANFHVESDEDVHADHWEIHPCGQEVVSVLAGQARLVLRAEFDEPQHDQPQHDQPWHDHTQDGRTEDGETVTLTVGTAFVVPRNRWHRLEVDGPTDLQSITVRRGTRLERRP